MQPDPLPETDTAADWARPLYAQQIAMLGELAEAGLAMALALKDRTEADPTQTAMAFGRAARAVRLSLMLQARLIKALEDRDAHRDHLSQSDARTARREKQARVERIVERVAEQADHDADDIETLVQEAAERLDEDDIYDLLARPVSELVALICHDLGLDPDWPHLAQEAWARQEMAGADTGWPLAGLGLPGGLRSRPQTTVSAPPHPHPRRN